MIKKWLNNIGPGPLVAAAFIGPGTVTLCSEAGVVYGYALLWAMVLSIIAAIVLQEMAARLGIITQQGLSENLKNVLKDPLVRWASILLILSAILIGNAAYEAGNIIGGVLGLETIFGVQSFSVGSLTLKVFPFIIGIVAFVLLFIGNYKYLEKVLVALVIFMSLAFLITAVMTKPDIAAIFKGAFIPTIPDGAILTIIGLIGTTVVPYNLFLHASLVKEKWKSETELKYAKKDTFVAIILGGLVSMCIIISATSVNLNELNNVADLAIALEPLFGSFSKYFLSIGLFAAGVTSAITAPLAAAYVVCGCLGWSSNMKTKKFRMVWMFVLFMGVGFASVDLKPMDIIKFAQVTNGILLPIIAGFLLWIVNKKDVLGIYKNSKLQNIMGVIILLVTIVLGAKSILKVFQLI